MKKITIEIPSTKDEIKTAAYNTAAVTVFKAANLLEAGAKALRSLKVVK